MKADEKRLATWESSRGGRNRLHREWHTRPGDEHGCRQSCPRDIGRFGGTADAEIMSSLRHIVTSLILRVS